jgi:hypothetical protein
MSDYEQQETRRRIEELIGEVRGLRLMLEQTVARVFPISTAVDDDGVPMPALPSKSEMYLERIMKAIEHGVEQALHTVR